MTVSTLNSRPLACIQSSSLVQVDDAVSLGGTCSSDADGDALSFQWSLTSSPAGSNPELSDSDTDSATLVPDLPGLYIVQLIVNDGELASVPVTATVTAELPPPSNHDPQIDSTPPAEATVGQPYVYDVQASDPDGDTLQYSLTTAPAGMSIGPASGQIEWTPTDADQAASPVPVTVRVEDGRGGSDIQSFAIRVQPGSGLIPVPGLVGLARSVAMERIKSARLNLGAFTYQHNANTPDGEVIAQTPVNGTPAAIGTAVDLLVSLGPDLGLPANPETIAPPLDPTVTTILADATEFLYTGSNPIQTGVTPGTIEQKRVAVIRGKVLDRDINPLPGVTVTILGHPEFGQTQSRADGAFDLAVNGGGYLVVDYQKIGYLPAQRQIQVPWQDYALVDDVVLIQRDASVTTIDLTAPVPFQVARGSVVTDDDGARQATLLFPQGLEAQIYDADGNLQPATMLHLRATEYTVGDNGPAAMPAALPPTSAYTYAVELSVDEATRKIDGKDVLFSQPVPMYLDNFLDVGVGAYVPVGFYDRDKAAWVPDYDGRVVKILSIAGGIAQLDTDGDNLADNGADLGVSEAERRELAVLYAEGKTLWRVALSHLSTIDLNFGGQPIDDPNQPPPEQPASDDDPCKQQGNSAIECQNQILHENIAVTGTPFNLHYASDRHPGRTASNRLKIQLSGPTLPSIGPKVWRILLTIDVAGRRFEYQYEAQPNLTHEFVWDGKDAMGRTLQGKQPITVRIGWAYTNIYGQPYIAVGSGLSRSFAVAPSGPLPGDVITRIPSYASQTFRRTIGAWDAKTAGLGGWDLDVHHAYDPVGKTLYLGNGERRGAINANNSATLVSDILSYDLAVAPDGTTLVGGAGGVLWRLDGSATPKRVAGGGTLGCSASGVPATELALAIWGFAIGPDGSIFIGDPSCGLVRRVNADGLITTVAGTYESCEATEGDGGPAIQACIRDLKDVDVAPDGTLHILSLRRIERSRFGDTYYHYVRRVGADGTILPTGCEVPWARSLAIAPNGDAYVGGDAAVDRCRKNGEMSRVAGTGVRGFGGDGSPATEALLNSVNDLALGPDGSLYLADTGNFRIRRIDSDGPIDTVFGGGPLWSRDGRIKVAPARQVELEDPFAVAVGQSEIFATSRWNNIWRIGSPLPGFTDEEIAIASEDGSELYKFSPEGRHLETLNTLTGAKVYQFGYDAVGRLVSVTDGDGNITVIERQADGAPTAVIAPFGQRTALSIDADGYLSGTSDPAGHTYAFTYKEGGLLKTLMDPNGHLSYFGYDSDGLLASDQNAATGGLTLERIGGYSDDFTVIVKKAEGSATNYRVERTSTNDRRWTNTFSDGTVGTALFKADDTTEVSLPDGTQTRSVEGADPRFGMDAPVPTSVTVNTPGGLTNSRSRNRSAELADANDILSLKRLTETATLNGRTTTSVYDAATRTTTNTSAAGRISTNQIDALGRPVLTQTAGLEPVAYAYDARGRLESLTQGAGPDARSVGFAYDANGYLAGITDALGRTAGFTYDPAGRVTAQTFPDSRQVLFAYDAKGNLTGLTPPGRPEHAFSYTPVDLTAEYVPPDVGAGTNSTGYSYNRDKQLTRVLRPDGVSVELAYDAAGRLETLAVPEGDFSYAYHAASGNLNRITAPDGGTLEFGYDGSLLTGATWSGGIAGSVGFAYDNDFRVSSVTVNGASPVAYSYDPDSLLTQAGILTLTRDTQNGLLTGSTLGTVTDDWDYNGFGEPESYSASQGGSPLIAIAYTRDQLGRITEKSETIGGVTTLHAYEYDLAGRLIGVSRDGAVQTGWGYDDNGNRTHVNGAEVAHYDDQDRLLDYAGTTYTYTANGELETRTQGASVTRYDYDVLGNLRQVRLPNGSVIDYLTDGRNRRIGKQVNGTLIQGFLYQDQLKPVAELDGAGNLVSRFVYATRVNVPDYMIKGGTSYRILTDHLGSPRLVVNTTDGTVVQRMDYDAWGKVTLDTNPGFQPFGFAGGLYDRDTGIVRFGARDYDAGVGRWLAKDPRGFTPVRLNQFEYVRANPASRIDPRGTSDQSWEEWYDQTEVGMQDWIKGKLPDLVDKAVEKGLENLLSDLDKRDDVTVVNPGDVAKGIVEGVKALMCPVQQQSGPQDPFHYRVSRDPEKPFKFRTKGLGFRLEFRF
ncbi:MAG: hypothetical protein KDI54_15605 [Gammaproteobacteria bacterium]|nr:hypothetical protein [Gammaproteobacteria bacterium]